MEKIKFQDLPSKGLITQMDVPLDPVCIGHIDRFVNLPTKTTAQRMYKDLCIYIKSINNWQDLCAYDYAAIVFYRKAFTVSDGTVNSKLSLTCPTCGNEITLEIDLASYLDFPEINEVLLKVKALKFNRGTIYKRIPTMDYLEEVLVELNKHEVPYDEPLIMFRTFFGFIENLKGVDEALYFATRDEANLITKMSEYCSCRPELAYPIDCNRCKEVISVARSDYFVTDPFRLIKENFEFPKEKVILS